MTTRENICSTSFSEKEDHLTGKVANNPVTVLGSGVACGKLLTASLRRQTDIVRKGVDSKDRVERLW
ncbi:hypothetical protein LOAG_14221 [Loa loa]|uniref:Uncharacterized protein n=1 Tax=Loa loa TaxID=7209 RepID=A0A1S0TIM4_LOALO|nr:hypothetical protein LOAG_14221 [Loa loa]EFO14300.2 hypothetical protein LOAG_14221 [Loa loa]